jgi:hypothetical protein
MFRDLLIVIINIRIQLYHTDRQDIDLFSRAIINKRAGIYFCENFLIFVIDSEYWQKLWFVSFFLIIMVIMSFWHAID